MEHIHAIHLRIIERRLGAIARELTTVSVKSLSGLPSWTPAANVYRYRDRFLVCIDLAGIELPQIDLRAEPFRIVLSAARCMPGLEESGNPPQQVLVLEIDSGPCLREITLPAEIVPEAVRAEQRNGLLWITLPLRQP